jgi:glucose/arabinose dehydrogenase
MTPEARRRKLEVDRERSRIGFRGAVAALALIAALGPAPLGAEEVLRGAAAFTDAAKDVPGTWHVITPADLPPPGATRSASHYASLVKRPPGVLPKVPGGFAVAAYASGLERPRLLRTAPNGDVFLAESRAGRIRVLRPDADGQPPERAEIFASGLSQPFGIAFYPPGPDPRWIYMAENGAVKRFPYRNGDLNSRGAAETVVPDLPSGGHWTRDLAFSLDGRRLFVSVGSASNVSDGPGEERRAAILQFTPDGKEFRTFASGIRNPVGIAVHPRTGELWTSVNERDGLGDDLPPDYVTRVREGGFYGWPWYYIGGNPDPRHKGAHPELRDRVIVPEVLVQPHSASMQLAFYTGEQFPEEYRGDAFAAEHGSWNRSRLAGYKVIRIRVKDGAPTGEYQDFMTGFVTGEGQAWGRPVGVTVAKDGALLVSDDASGTVWRVTAAGR